VARVGAERKGKAGEEIVTLDGCTLANFKLMATGLGFDVHFTVPLSEKEKLPTLTDALQRSVTVKVSRYSRRKSANGTA